MSAEMSETPRDSTGSVGSSRVRLTHHPDWWRVRDVMTSPVVGVAPDAPDTEIVDLLLERGMAGLPVTDDRGGLLGIVTEADFVRREAERAATYGDAAGGRLRAETVAADRATGAGVTAAALMSAPAVTASPDDDLPSTARTLIETGHCVLPVVADDGRVVGIVSRRDLLTPAWVHASAER